MYATDIITVVNNETLAETTYTSFSEAFTYSQTLSSATIALCLNTEFTSAYTVKNNLTITGDNNSYVFSRGTNYTGALFTINSGATLTLDGGLIIDGNNNWLFDEEVYFENLKVNGRIQDNYTLLTPEINKPVATAYLINVKGTLNLLNVEFRNCYSKTTGLVTSSTANAMIYINGIYVHNCCNATSSGLVVSMSAALNCIVDDCLIENNFVGNNHGIFRVYSKSILTLNGGLIQNNKGCNANGTIVGTYSGTFIMNGGTIHGNCGLYGKNNGRTAPVYIHNYSTMIMNGGEICHNYGAYGGIDAPYTNGASRVTINDGSIVAYNTSTTGNINNDINGHPLGFVINGGTFTQDVSKFCSEGFELMPNEDGTYGVKEEEWKFYVKVNGEILPAVIYGCQDGIIKKLSIPTPTWWNKE